MSLHNKKTQLLGNDHKDDNDIDDIFAQYGGDDGSSVDDSVQDETSVESAVEEPSQKEQDVPEIEDAIANLNEGVELEVPDEKNPEALEEVAVQEVDEVVEEGVQEKVEAVEVVQEEKLWEQKEQDGSAGEEKVESQNKSEDVEEIEKEQDMPGIENVIAEKREGVVEEDGSLEEDETEEEVEIKEPVQSVAAAPPVRSNINAVIEKEKSTSQPKKSFSKEEKKDVYEVHIDPSKKTIAIIDDDFDTLDMYADVFENADYNVLRAHDGLEALSLINDHTPHLIFTGIVMPRMDGFSLIEALKQNARTADIPVVINSHLGRDSDKKKAEELGAKDFIVRGFTPPREAVERIGALLLRSEYVFRFDHQDPEAVKLSRDLGAHNFYVCPRGQEIVLKVSVDDPAELKFSARFSCVDEKKK